MIDEAKGRNFETDVEGFYRRATKSGERNRRKISSQPGSFNATLGFRCTVEHVRLYEDRHPWPIKCPACCNEFVEQIGRLRLHERARSAGRLPIHRKNRSWFSKDSLESQGGLL